MQVTSYAARPYFNTATLASAGAPSQAAEQPPAEEPKDGFGTRARKVIGGGMINMANDWDLAIGGAAAITTGLATTYAGVLGGAILGAAIGGGLGPMLAAATTHGVLGFLGTAWSTTAIGAKVGMTAGGFMGVAGGFALGQAVAGVPAKGIRWAGKKLAGIDPDAGDDGGKKKLFKLTGPLKVVGSAMAGVGALSGAIGGVAIGGGVSAAGSAVSGLINGNFSMANLAATAGTGAIVGGAVFMAAGAVGGYLAVKALRQGITSAVDAAHNSRRWMELDEKENRLTQTQVTTDEIATDEARIKTDADTNHSDRTKELDEREEKLGKQEERIKYKNEHVNELVDKRAQELYDTTKAGLIRREADQNTRQTHLENEDKRVNDKAAHVDQFIQERQEKLYNDLQNKLEGHYQQRKSGLERRSQELDQREAQIPQVVAQKVDQALSPLRRELEQHQNNARQADQQASSLHTQAMADLAAVPGVRAQASSERSAADQAERRADDLRPDFQRLNGEVNSKRTQVESRKYDLARREARVEECEHQHKKP